MNRKLCAVFASVVCLIFLLLGFDPKLYGSDDNNTQTSVTVTLSGQNQPYGTVIVASTNPTTMSAQVSYSPELQPSNPEASITDITYSCSAGIQFKATTQSSWGAPPSDASVTVQPASPSSDSNFLISATLPDPGYYQVSASGSIGYNNAGGPQQTASTQPTYSYFTAYNYTFSPDATDNPITTAIPTPFPTYLKVSPKEPVKFTVQGLDFDRKKKNPDGPRELIEGDGPYQSIWTCSVDGDFGSINSGLKQQVVNALTSSMVKVYPRDGWSGTPITVTCTLRDNAPTTVPTPDEGTTKDPDLVLPAWTLAKRPTPPTDIKRVGLSPNGTWVAAPASYQYLVGTDSPPAYQSQAVDESFGIPSANGFFTMSDLTPAWKAAHPTITTADDTAAFLFGPGASGTFVLDANDNMVDVHYGFGDTSAFTAAAIAGGIGWRLPQTYSASDNVLGQYTIDRKMVGTTVTICKNGP